MFNQVFVSAFFWNFFVNKFFLLNLNPKTAAAGVRVGRGVSKGVSSKEREKPWFFVTFNIILKQIFPESFSEFPQVVQKI